MCGVEAASASPIKVASLTAAVIDVFKSRNNNHNANQFFSTISGSKNDFDPPSSDLRAKSVPAEKDYLQETRRNIEIPENPDHLCDQAQTKWEMAKVV